MKVHKMKLAIAAAALVAAPVAAQSVGAIGRTTTPVAGASELGGDGEIGPAIIIAALAGIGIAVLLLTDDDDEDQPISA